MAAILLACGHEVAEVIEIDGEPRCAACEREAATDSEAVEEAVEAEPGGPQDKIRAGAAHAGERQDTESEGADSTPPQPAYGARGEQPGARGCWALNTRGEPCGSIKRADSDFCTAHT